MFDHIVVAQPESVTFVADDQHHTIGAARAAAQWLSQWTAPNNYPAFVGKRVGASEVYGLPEGAIDAWRAVLTSSLKSALPEHPSLRPCDFSFNVRISAVASNGQFWPGHVASFQL